MKFVPKGPINNIPALVHIMAWRRPGDEPLSEPMLVSLTTHICVTRPQWVNSLAPGRCGSNFRSTLFKLIIQNSGYGTYCYIALKWMPRNHTNKKSMLVQVMAWCHQATSHYMSQSWPSSMSSPDLNELKNLTFLFRCKLISTQYNIERMRMRLSVLHNLLHSLWSGDAVWQQGSGSALAWCYQAITWINVD